MRAISVRRDGVVFPCEAELEPPRRASPSPHSSPGRPVRYALHADAILEDIAGNRIGRAFDIDRADPAQRDGVARDAELVFEI